MKTCEKHFPVTGRKAFLKIWIGGAALVFLFFAPELLAAPPAMAPAQDLIAPSVPDAVGGKLDPKVAESHPDALKVIPTLKQDQINQKVLNSLVVQAGWFPEVKVQVENGMVTIEGQAKNHTQLDWLAKTADRLPSVIAVINKATVVDTPVSDFTPVWTECKSIIERVKRALPGIAITLVLFVIAIFINKFLGRTATRFWKNHISNPFLLKTVTKISMFPLWMIFFYLAMQVAGLTTLAATIVGGTGIAGIVFGFAFKDIAENYLAGLLLAFRSPFTKGDLITIEPYTGYVQGLEMRGTTLVDTDGNLMLIPNTIVIKSVIKNFTATPSSRLNFTIPISYVDSIATAQAVILQILSETPGVLAEPKPAAVVDQVSNGNVVLKVYFWYNVMEQNSILLKSKAMANTKEALIAKGLGVPDSSTTVHFPDALKIHSVANLQDSEIQNKQKKQEEMDQAESNLRQEENSSQSSADHHRSDVHQLIENASKSPLAAHKPIA